MPLISRFSRRLRDGYAIFLFSAYYADIISHCHAYADDIFIYAIDYFIIFVFMPLLIFRRWLFRFRRFQIRLRHFLRLSLAFHASSHFQRRRRFSCRHITPFQPPLSYDIIAD
jgi:hypothetical protein